MRNVVFCLMVLGLDIALALAGARAITLPVFSTTWSGVPVSILAGTAGIACLVVFTLVVSALAFPKQARP